MLLLSPSFGQDLLTDLFQLPTSTWYSHLVGTESYCGRLGGGVSWGDF